MSEPNAESPNLPSQLSPTDIDTFLAHYNEIDGGTRFSLLSMPDEDQAQLLAKQPNETSIIQLNSLEVILAKGMGRTSAAFTREELLEMKPKAHIHTHPTQRPNPDKLRAILSRLNIPEAEADIEGLSNLALIIPSPGDLTLGSVGAEKNEIWSEFGKTTYTTYPADSDAAVGFALQMIGNLYSGKTFFSILTDKSLDQKSKIIKLNEVLKSVGVSFEFTPWEKKESDKKHQD